MGRYFPSDGTETTWTTVVRYIPVSTLIYTRGPDPRAGGHGTDTVTVWDEVHIVHMLHMLHIVGNGPTPH